MNAEDVIEEAADLIGRNSPCVMTKDEARSLAQLVAPLIAKAERERCAREIDCGCPGRETVLNVTNNGRGNTNGAVRWTSCGRDLCSALEAAAIRALPDA